MTARPRSAGAYVTLPAPRRRQRVLPARRLMVPWMAAWTVGLTWLLGPVLHAFGIGR